MDRKRPRGRVKGRRAANVDFDSAVKEGEGGTRSKTDNYNFICGEWHK